MTPGPSHTRWQVALLALCTALGSLVALTPPAASQATPAAASSEPPSAARAVASQDTPLAPTDPVAVATPGPTPDASAAAASPASSSTPSGGTGASGGAASGARPTPTSTTMVAIDRPAAGENTGQRFTIMGWAADPEGPGSGVDAVQVYLDGEMGSGAFLGAANYGEERLDVAAQLGQPRFGLSGYSLEIEIPPGPHTLYVQARRRSSNGSGAWSPPATVDVVAAPAVSVSESGRVQLPSAGCARAPDGSCINRMVMPAPTCPQIGPNGQCLPATAAQQPPGWVGAPAQAPGTPGACPQHDATGTCPSTSGTSTPANTTFTLRAETSAGMATLSWNTLPGAATYDLLRCPAATGQGCTSVSVLSTTSYQIPQSPNTWYVVQARSGNGQVIGTTNVVGPT